MDLLDVLRVLDVLDVPAVGLVARAVVLPVERKRGRAVDRDPVVVVADDQLAEREVARYRRRFLADALHHVAVGADHVDVVVDDLVGGSVEAVREETLGDRHSDGVGDALPERPRRHLDAGRVAALGVARRARAPLAELFEVRDAEVVAGEMKQRVLQHAGVARAEDEAVTVGPLRVVRVGAQEALEDRVGEGRERHRRPRMPGVRLLHSVHREPADRVDRQTAQLDVPTRCGAGGTARLARGGHRSDPTHSRHVHPRSREKSL